MGSRLEMLEYQQEIFGLANGQLEEESIIKGWMTLRTRSAISKIYPTWVYTGSLRRIGFGSVSFHAQNEMKPT